MISFAVKLHNDRIPNEDKYPEHIIRALYLSVEKYFKKEEDKDNDKRKQF